MRVIAREPTTRTGVCVVRAESPPSGGFLITVTTNADISRHPRIEMSQNVVRVDKAVELVARFLSEWAEHANEQHGGSG